MTTAVQTGAATQEKGEKAATRAKAIASVVRITAEALISDELDLGAALLLGMDVVETAEGFRVVDRAGVPVEFSPSSNWDHYGVVVSNVEIVVGTHARYEDKDDPERVTGHWYDAHAFFGSTHSEGNDLRTTVLKTVVKRLAHETKYPRD